MTALRAILALVAAISSAFYVLASCWYQWHGDYQRATFNAVWCVVATQLFRELSTEKRP